MCIIIDTNSLHSVFKPASSDHAEFKPILNWIMEGKGKVVFGGTKYINELSKTSNKYLALFNELKKKNKAFISNRDKVDEYEAALKIQDLPGFNDHHLIAIVAVSGCKLLCTQNVSKQAKDIKYITRISCVISILQIVVSLTLSFLKKLRVY